MPGRPDRYDFADDDDSDERPRRRPADRERDRPRSKRPDAGRRREPDDEDRPRARKPAAAKSKAPSPWLLLLAIPVIGFIVFMAVRQSRNWAAEQGAFAAEMDKWVSAPAAGAAKATPGKVALIDVVKRELHYLHESDGGDWSDLQAATPRDATIIVQVRVTDREVREYPNGRKGVKQTFHLTVIDKATWTKIDERTFEGGDPPETISLKRGGGTNEPVAGTMPTKDIRTYLRALASG